MKKIVLSMAASLMSLCGFGQEFNVTGFIEGLQDGDTVYLEKVLADTPTDRAVIKNGMFHLSGTPDPTTYYYIIYLIKNRRNGGVIFLESGDMTLTSNIGGPMKVHGTPINDAYTSYYEVIDSLYLVGKRARMGIDSLPKTEQEKRNKLYFKVQNEMTQLTNETAEANLNNAFGIYLMGLETQRISPDQWDKLYDAAPSNLKEDESVKLYKQYRDGMKNTAIGKQYIDIKMQTPEGKWVKLSDYVSKNKLTMLDFWASWCGPCCGEIPFMKKALQQYGPDGFGIVGVSLDNKAEAWKQAIEKYKINWPQMSNINGGGSDGALLYGLTAIPATFLIDSQGTIVAKDVRGENLITKVGELLKK